VAEKGQLRECSARPGLAGRIGHWRPGHQGQGQIVHAQLLRLAARVEDEMPAQQGRARFGAEQRGQLLIRGDFGVPGGEPVVRPADGVIFGERGARVGRVALEDLPCVDRVACHGPAPDLRAGAYHRAAAAARLDQPLVPEQRHRVPDDDFGHPVGVPEFLHGGQPRTRRVPAGLDLLPQLISHN
jgi:hypothetical protein